VRGGQVDGGDHGHHGCGHLTWDLALVAADGLDEFGQPGADVAAAGSVRLSWRATSRSRIAVLASAAASPIEVIGGHGRCGIGG
jgi:hypothetical protein